MRSTARVLLFRSGLPLVVLAFVALLGVALAGGSAAKTAPATIGIENFTFKADALTVAAGTEVTWVNHDDVPHKIVSTDKKFPSSPVLDTDGRFSYTFTRPGTYAYYCSIHPTMTGKVVVK